MFIRNNHTLHRFFTVPKIPPGIFILFLLATILVTGFSVMTGYQTRESNLAEHQQVGKTIITP